MKQANRIVVKIPLTGITLYAIMKDYKIKKGMMRKE